MAERNVSEGDTGHTSFDRALRGERVPQPGDVRRSTERPELPAADRVHRRPMKVDRAGCFEQELGDSPAGIHALEAMPVAAPELAVRRAVDVAVPGIEVRDGAGRVAALEPDPDVGDVVARAANVSTRPRAIVEEIAAAPTIVAVSGP